MDLDRTKFTALVVAGLLGLMIYRVCSPSTTFAADGTDPDWDAAVQRSRATHQPTVVLFTADWCPACQALHNNVLTRPDVQTEMERHYTCYKVDLTNPTPAAQAHAQKFGVQYIP